MDKWKMTAKSDLKKYAKLNGYSANATSIGSFKYHLCAKFSISQAELVKACAKNKIIIVASLATERTEENNYDYFNEFCG
jgi:hypothetical protein